MPTPAGWVTSEKRQDRTSNHTTLSPSGYDKWGLDVSLKGTVYELERDLVEAGSVGTLINATAHNARVGDLIRFTNGAAINYEQYVFEVTANTITLWNDIPIAPGAGDEFAILRAVTLTLGADGSFSGPVKFIQDGGIVDVTEDTVTPANNQPLPVKLTSVTGDINITANDLNVQTSHAGANPDSVQIGDGTEVMAINASNEAQVRDDDANTTLTGILADTAAMEISLANIDTDIDVNLSTRASEVTAAAILADTASIDASVDVALSTRASEVTAAAILADTAAIDTATANIDTSIDVALSTRASEVTAAAILADTAAIDTATASIDTSIDVALSTRASEVTAAAILADTAAIDTATASIDTSIDVALSTRASEVTAAAILADTAAIDTATATIAGWDTNAGAVSAATQRVHLTDETLAALENITVIIDPLTVVATTYTDSSATNIPGNASAPLELIASTAADIKKLQFADTTGVFLEIMTGAAASEVRAALIGPGSDQTIELDIVSGTRISVRSIQEATAVSVGSLAINYIG